MDTQEAQELQKEIVGKIEELDQRIIAGEKIIKDCKKQMRMLLLRVKHLEQVKQQVILMAVSDGDL